MTRARESVKLNMRQVEDMLKPHVNRGSLQRLEAQLEVPTYQADRGRAALLLLLYGYDLGPFGISPDDFPRLIDLNALNRLRKQRKRGLWCIHDRFGATLAAA